MDPRRIEGRFAQFAGEAASPSKSGGRHGGGLPAYWRNHQCDTASAICGANSLNTQTEPPWFR